MDFLRHWRKAESQVLILQLLMTTVLSTWLTVSLTTQISGPYTLFLALFGFNIFAATFSGLLSLNILLRKGQWSDQLGQVMATSVACLGLGLIQSVSPFALPVAVSHGLMVLCFLGVGAGINYFFKSITEIPSSERVTLSVCLALTFLTPTLWEARS